MMMVTDHARPARGQTHRAQGTGRGRLGFLVVLVFAVGSTAWGQIPGVPASKPAAAPTTKDDPSASPIPAKGEPGAIFSTTAGPIKVDPVVADPKIERVLSNYLIQYPGVRAVSVEAKGGFVTIDGQASDEPTINKVTTFAQRVEGVVAVINRMKTDAEVLTGAQIAANVLRHYGEVVAQKWLVFFVALGFFLGFAALARLFGRSSDTLLRPFVHNSLLRSVVGSIVGSLLILTGVMIALSILELTQAVLSLLGLAGVVTLAVGFAFRDIVENFIASMLLGIRRPFGIGDFITVAGRSGSVLSLDTRATTLITPEGNLVRIPNAVIYKETMVNASITPSTLGTIEVLIPYEASIAAATEAMTEALCSADALLSDPKPRVLVQALEATGVRLKATYWMPTKGTDNDKIQSDLRLKIKVGLQQIGISPPSTPTTVAVAAPSPIALTPGRPAPAVPPARNGSHGPQVTPPPGHLDPGAPKAAPAISAADLRKDSEAAAVAGSDPTPQEATPIDHAIRQAEAAAASEGGNLLVGNGKPAS